MADRNKGDKGKKSKKPERETLHLHVCVCGLPRVVDLYMRQVNNLYCETERFVVYIDPSRGNDHDGRVNSGGADLTLCVYDVRDRLSVAFLKDYILPHMRGRNENMVIAGLGLEWRTGGQDETDIGTVNRLARQCGCRGSELICCDGHQMAAGTFALYAQVHPDDFDSEDESGKDKKPGWGIRK